MSSTHEFMEVLTNILYRQTISEQILAGKVGRKMLYLQKWEFKSLGSLFNHSLFIQITEMLGWLLKIPRKSSDHSIVYTLLGI